MAARIDITGQKFNRWTAVEYLGGTKYRCVCECGNEGAIFTVNLKRGMSKSCGCIKAETKPESAKRKALIRQTPEYKAAQKEYRERNAESLREKKRLYREANKERLSEGKRRCYEAKREHYKARVMDNYAADPEQAISRERLKATLRKEATPIWADLAAIKELYREARRLTKETGIRHHVDHEIPLRHKLVCGLHVQNNMRVIEASLNWRKHNHFNQEEKP